MMSPTHRIVVRIKCFNALKTVYKNIISISKCQSLFFISIFLYLLCTCHPAKAERIPTQSLIPVSKHHKHIARHIKKKKKCITYIIEISGGRQGMALKQVQNCFKNKESKPVQVLCVAGVVRSLAFVFSHVTGCCLLPGPVGELTFLSACPEVCPKGKRKE